MATLKTATGERIIIDPEFYQILKQFNWFVKNGYACTTIKEKYVLMHRLLMGKMFSGPSVVIDHINGNKIDNRLSNLQVVNHGQNSQKAKKPREPYFIGVTKFQGCYDVRIKINRKGVFKRFKDPIEAAKFYDSEVTRIHGANALTNHKFYKSIVKKLAQKP